MQYLEYISDAIVPLKFGQYGDIAVGDFDKDGEDEIIASGGWTSPDSLIGCYDPEGRYRKTFVSKIASWEGDIPLMRAPMEIALPGRLVQALPLKEGHALLAIENDSLSIFKSKEESEGILVFEVPDRITLPMDKINASVKGKINDLSTGWWMVDGDAGRPGTILLGTRNTGDYWPKLEPKEMFNAPFEKIVASRIDKDWHWKGGEMIGRYYRLDNIGKEKSEYSMPQPLLDSEGNPLELPYGFGPLCVVDFDGDGDWDLLYGSFLNYLYYIEDIGTPGKPRWQIKGEVLGEDDKPLRYSAPYLNPYPVGWKGKKNILCRCGGGEVWLARFIRFSSSGSPVFSEPEQLMQIGGKLAHDTFITPVVCDLDGDGRCEIISGCERGYIMHHKAKGNTIPPKFSTPEYLKTKEGIIHHFPAKDGRMNVQGPVEDYFGYTGVTVGDWTGNSTLDLIVVDSMGEFTLYRNIGTVESPSFAPGEKLHQEGKVFQSVWRQRPWLVDFDEDKVNELVALDHLGYLRMYKHLKGSYLELDKGTIFSDEEGKPIKLDRSHNFEHVNAGRIQLQVIDLDEDGKLDIVYGFAPRGKTHTGVIKWLKNIGTNQNPCFRRMGYIYRNGWPLVGSTHTPSPCLADLDNDGKLELLVGCDAGAILYLDHDEFYYQRGIE